MSITQPMAYQVTRRMRKVRPCRDCKWWKPIDGKLTETWGTCDYEFPFLPFWVKINPYGAISPNQYGCPTWEAKEIE